MSILGRCDEDDLRGLELEQRRTTSLRSSDKPVTMLPASPWRQLALVAALRGGRARVHEKKDVNDE